MNRTVQHNGRPVITVAVPAYGRPDMMKDLIKSFQLQNYSSAELLIVDDCVEDQSVKQVVKKFQSKDERIRYIKNKVNLGYSKNFLKVLTMSRGDYIVTLGDDDVFIDPHALQKYVTVFSQYPRVGCIYSNIIQFNQHNKMDYACQHFEADILFKKVEESLKHVWLKTCYIPGIGLRNTNDFQRLYPRDDLLFPQVELIGKLLGSSSSYGISDYLIGGRAHNQQLGFFAIKGERIKHNEKHSVEELGLIFDRLKKFYSRELHLDLNLSNSFIDQFFEQSHATIFPNEKINAGNKRIIKTFLQAYKNNSKVLLNKRFLFYFTVSLILPRRLLAMVKEKVKQRIVKRKFQQQKYHFDEFMNKMKA